MLFEFARANSYRSAYTDEINQVRFANLISVSILKHKHLNEGMDGTDWQENHYRTSYLTIGMSCGL
jgi:hypothetical protein